ncbi:dTDP-4-amino-4,6-dideoxygalactose transaminase [Nocardioides scoriae]|uniref:dTDP-4-amino-4,6-dideoxygalactose transaminase n=1 Tax=Nocardioides scoriae TaxID=642780 RepID=A0A1H1UZH8_9ACTN|nr:DegT/DnrJ/EryC1/StrS family aminotransferase [Nocardioides scoriae]SDS77516.1 dTDP-4-amino-4,6-dideoxygalactose transaminase [Nocardioides scoriae]
MLPAWRLLGRGLERPPRREGPVITATAATTASVHVPVYRPYLGEEVQEAARAALEAGWLGMGKLSRDFETGLEDYLGLTDRHVVSTNSCTEALHIAARLIGLGPGDEVICPSFTYVAGHQALSRTGADIVFCDVEPDTLCIDPDQVRALITDRTRAILAVDYLGLPCKLDELMQIAHEHGLRVIEDAAHAFGTLSDGRPVGSFGDITCFSFGPVKMMTTLEGGAVVTGDPADTQVLRELRHLGIDSDTDARYRNQRNWDFDVVRQGYRCHLGSVPSAIGLAQLAMVDEFIGNRQDYCRYYDAQLGDLDGLQLFETDWEGIAPYIYVVRVRDPELRQDLVEHLKSRGVATGIHFLGAHEFSFYADARRGPLDVTELATQQVLTLPLHPYMDTATLDRVVSGIRSFFEAAADGAEGIAQTA